jgi:HEAT repeat protein
VRRHAVETIAKRHDPALVHALVDALREGHRDFSVLSSALKLLAVTGVDLTTALADLLRHPEADLRIQAALGLGMQRSPDAVAPLLEALDDVDDNVRFHAIESLGRLHPPSAVEPLARIAESHDFFLAFPALDALARIQDPGVAHRIVPLLADELIGDQAADALGQIGDEDSVGPLVAALERPGVSVASIVGALAAIHRRYENMPAGGAHIEAIVRQRVSAVGGQQIIDTAARATGASLRDCIVCLGWLRGAAVERALTLMLGRADAQHELIEAIVRFGSPMVDRLVTQLGQEDRDARRAAAIALGRIGDARAVPALLAQLAADDRELFVPIVGALARLGDRRAFEPLLALLGDHDVSVRHAAIGALNSIGHPGMAARIHALLGDADPVVRESAVKIAGYFGYAECADDVIACCGDASETVRASALAHVAYLDDPRVLPLLRTALERDTPRPRAAAAQALAHVDDPAAVDALRDGAADVDPWVRYFSVKSLGRRGDRSALPLLERVATGDEPEPVCIVAVEAIGHIGGDDAARALASLADATAPELALAAVRALGRVNVVAALAPLKRALGSTEPARRVAAADALSCIAQDSSTELLAWTAAADGDSNVWRAAIDGLVRIGSGSSSAAAAAIGALAGVASDGERRPEVIGALARIPSSAIPAVGAALSSRDPHVRCAVIEALGRLSHPTASGFVRTALVDGDAAVRQLAVVVLSRLGTHGLTHELAALARTDPSEGVRRAAAMALHRGHEWDGADGEHEARP